MGRGNENSGDQSIFPQCAGDRTSLAGVLGNSGVNSWGKGRRLLLPVEFRVWVYTEFTPGCWLWRAGKTPDGYGKICETLPGGLRTYHLTHVLAYRWTVGEIPAGLRLDHTCRIRSCLNPQHLEPVTNEINSQRGETAKLNPEAVIQIREYSAAGASQMSLARQYDVSHKAIQKVLAGESWANVGGKAAAV